MVDIQPCPVAQFFTSSESSRLLADYAAECAITGMPTPQPDVELYQMLEQAGRLHLLTAVLDGEIVGFLALLIAPNPHYSVQLATSESFFVAPEHRDTGAGMKLLRHAETLGREFGAAGMFISAPTDSRLDRVLAASADHAATNRVFFKALS